MIGLWRGVDTRGGGSDIVRFAIRLFSIVPNSAGTERFFSRMGLVQTKHRNRLDSDKARKLVLVKANIDRMFGTGRSEQHRHFGHDIVSEDGSSSPLSDTIALSQPEPSSLAATPITTPPSASFSDELVQDAQDDSEPEPSDSEPDAELARVPREQSGRSNSIRRNASSQFNQSIPRSEALLLCHIFDYPSTPLSTVSESPCCLLTSFWNCSKDTLGAECAMLKEEEAMLTGDLAPTESISGKLYMVRYQGLMSLPTPHTYYTLV